MCHIASKPLAPRHSHYIRIHVFSSENNNINQPQQQQVRRSKVWKAAHAPWKEASVREVHGPVVYIGLGGGFKYFLRFTSLFGEDFHFD